VARGLGVYPNLVIAAYYVAQNLQTSLWSWLWAIVTDLNDSAPPLQTAKDLWNSRRASAHCYYGAGWHSGPVPVVAAPVSRW
jgi:hypothetical protein